VFDPLLAGTPPIGDGASTPLAVAGELAAAAWRAAATNHRTPLAVEPVRARKPAGRCVFRLVGAADDGAAVIAKRCRIATYHAEHRIYQRVLPLVPVRTPRYYGNVDAGDGFVWVFLEDVGSQNFSPDDSAQRALAGRWLGELHTAAWELPVTSRLPDRGPRHYRAHLDAGRRLIRTNLENPALLPDDVAVLRSVLTACDAVAERWDQLAEVCTATPATLIHGDFRPKNVFVRTATAEPQLIAVDWEMAGRGTPAVDLAPSRECHASHVDLDVYCRVVRQAWPWFSTTMAERLLIVGLIFRRLAAIEWAASSLASARPRVLAAPVASLRVYQQELERALADATQPTR
jgi:aminoglycoside phosphotransferase (APT) family kinase protein